MHFHNDPSDTIDEFLPNWDEMTSEFDEAELVQRMEDVRRSEYASLADL